MCGITGYQFVNGKCADNSLLCRTFIQALLVESKARGLHATGVAYLDEGRFRVCKAPVPAHQFIESPDWQLFLVQMPTSAILHTRYCTSGTWEEPHNNQPLALGAAALSHNGIVSMAEQDQFQETYRIRTTTSNDSEIILRYVNGFLRNGESAAQAVDHALFEIQKIETPIFACGVLTSGNELLCVRDDARPLYHFLLPELGLVGFTSTRDIFERAVRSSGLQRTGAELYACTPYVLYNLTTDSTHTMTWCRHDEAEELASRRQWSFGHGNQTTQNCLSNPEPRILCPSNHTVDYRQNRKEGFIQYYAAMVVSKDIDPAFPTLNEIFRRYELSLEQQFWCAFLYATFYHNATVFLVLQEFPELHKIDMGRLQDWHATNWKLLLYQVDRRWNKGHFIEMVKSYRQLIGNQTQEEFFSKLLVPDDPVASFDNCWTELHKVFKMGRHSVYAWTETLIRCLGLRLQCPSFYMDIAESSRNGLCYAIDRDDLVTYHNKKPSDGTRISKEEICYLEKELEHLMADIRKAHPSIPVDYMYMETSCCAYKGLHGRGRYLGYYLDRMAGELRRGEKDMAGISTGVDWGTLWQIRSEIFPPEFLGEQNTPTRFGIRDELCGIFMERGELVNLDLVETRGRQADVKCVRVKRSHTSPDWLDLKGILKRVCVSENTVRSWIHRPQNPLPAVMVDRKLLVRAVDLDRWLSSHRVVNGADIAALADEIVAVLVGRNSGSSAKKTRE